LNTINPTGDVWNLSEIEETTVVIATDALQLRIEGKFRQRERKLFILLIHAVWEELGKQRYHFVEIEKIKGIFTQASNIRSFEWLWEYLENLAEVKVTYRTDKLRGLFRLFASVQVDDERKNVKFQVPEDLIEILLAPQNFARLRTHFILGLKGKYSISLYQLLESKINLKKFNPRHTQEENQRYIDIKLDELKGWLGIGGDYSLWGDFNRRILAPSIQEINSNPIASTFTINHEILRGKQNKVLAIRFFLHKTEERMKLEQKIADNQVRQIAQYTKKVPPFQGTVIYENAKKHARGLDVYLLEQEWRESIEKNQVEVNNPHAHFLGFVKLKAKKIGVR
jgi:plasmid replication initiation protein